MTHPQHRADTALDGFTSRHTRSELYNYIGASVAGIATVKSAMESWRNFDQFKGVSGSAYLLGAYFGAIAFVGFLQSAAYERNINGNDVGLEIFRNDQSDD